MRLFLFLLLTIACCSVVQGTKNRREAQNDLIPTDETRLHEDLMDEYGRWNPGRVLIPLFYSQQIQKVKFGLGLTSILAYDPDTQVATVSTWERYFWNDAILEWNPQDYGGVRQIRTPITRIWRPDVVLYNAVDPDDAFENQLAVVKSDGSVRYVSKGSRRIMCNEDLDSNIISCPMKFGSWTFDGFRLDLDFYDDLEGIDINNYVLSDNFELVNQSAVRNVKYYPCCVESYIDLTFKLQFKKRTCSASTGDSCPEKTLIASSCGEPLHPVTSCLSKCSINDLEIGSVMLDDQAGSNVNHRSSVKSINDSDTTTFRCFNGTWRELEEYIPAPCDRWYIYRPENAVVDVNSTSHGGRVHYSCPSGYRLVGDEYLTCHDRQWRIKDAWPKCEPIYCERPGPLENGAVWVVGSVRAYLYEDALDKNLGHERQIVFRCNEGYERVGAKRVTCLEGTWTPNITTQCVMAQPVTSEEEIEVFCGPPGVIENGRIVVVDEFGKSDASDYTKFFGPNQIEFECNEGYERVGESGASCLEGSWTPAISTQCLPENESTSCARDLTTPRNGEIRYRTTRNGYRAMFTCRRGYRRKGRKHSTCRNGRWNGQPPKCVPMYCDYPGVIENGKILLVGVIGKYEYREYVKNVGQGDRIEFHCDPGYMPVGDYGATCQSGKWYPEITTQCEPQPEDYYMNEMDNEVMAIEMLYPDSSQPART